ncbi:MAG: IS1 family transposase [Snowella sp.]|nr:IS1 family transposase [Snowella sp.]
MQCPHCQSTHIRKNGINKQRKQNYICVTCRRQFINNYEKQKGYDEKTKQECLTAYRNGMGFREIERLTGVHHTTIINWVKSLGKSLPTEEKPGPLS